MRPLIIGTMNIDGEDLTGIFIEANNIKELKSTKHLFSEEVEIVKKGTKTQSGGFTSIKSVFQNEISLRYFKNEPEKDVFEKILMLAVQVDFENIRKER